MQTSGQLSTVWQGPSPLPRLTLKLSGAEPCEKPSVRHLFYNLRDSFLPCIHQCWACVNLSHPSFHSQNPISKTQAESFLKGRQTAIWFQSSYTMFQWTCLEPTSKIQSPRKWDTGLVPLSSGQFLSVSVLQLVTCGTWWVGYFNTHLLAVSVLGWQVCAFPLEFLALGK